MIRAGEMRHRVRIEQRSGVQDAAGEPEVTWLSFAERRAAMRADPGSEIFSSEKRNGRVPTVFHLRYLAGVKPQMRVVHIKTGQVFDILSAADPDGRRAELVITTLEHTEETAP
jgi:head-tail adaptor